MLKKKKKKKKKKKLSRLVQTLSGPSGVSRGTHSMFFKKFANSFLGSDLVSALMKTGLSRLAALETAQKLLDKGLVVCLVSQSGKFAEANVFRFKEDEVSPTKYAGGSAGAGAGAGAGGGPKPLLVVNFSDGSEKRLDFGLNVNVRSCVKQIAASLDMTVGVEEWSLGNKSSWLNNDLLVSDQWSMADGALRFRKKYFLTDAQLPPHGKERMLLFYQLRTTLVNGTLICTQQQMVKLAALAAQEQLQDRDLGKHTRVDVRPFLPEACWSTCDVPTLEAWTALRGRQRADVIFEFTDLIIKEVPTFGIYRFSVVEPGIKDKAKRDLGITSTHLFRIADNSVVEQMRLEDLRTWNFTPKSIELEFLPSKREKYVAMTTRGREILALLSEYQYFNRTRGGVSDTIMVHLLLRPGDAPGPKQCKVDISKTSREVIVELLKTFSEATKGVVDPGKAAFFSLRTASRWLSADEKLGGLRESELWLEPRTDLHQAAEDGDTARGRTLLSQGCPINAPDLYGNTALHAAVGNHQKLFVLLLLGHEEVNVNAVNLAGEPAIDKVLDLSNSGITHLPPSIAQCKSLTKRLDLSGNKLMTIPQEFRGLKVDELLLAGNPLPGIPSSVIAAGSSQVLSFLRDTSQTWEWKRCKVLFVGPDSSGRSDLVRILAKGRLARGSARAGLTVVDVPLSSDIELCCFDVHGGEFFERTQPILYSKRSIFCLVYSWKDLEVERILGHVQRIDASLESPPPLVLFMTNASSVDDKTRSTLAASLTAALQPFAPRLGSSPFVNVNIEEETAVHLAAFSTLKARFSALNSKEMQVPRSFQCLHVFLQSLLPGPLPLALQPGLSTKVFVSPVHSHVAGQLWNKPPRLPGVISWEELTRYASDAFVVKEHLESAVKHLVEIGSLLRVGSSWFVLDPSLFVHRVRDLLSLQGTTLDGIVPYAVLRSLWPDIPSVLLPQLVSLLEGCNLVAAFHEQSFLFVPSLIAPQKKAPSWSASIFVPRYVSEWRSAAALPDLFQFRIMVHLARRVSVERVWARGVLIASGDDGLRIKLEFLPNDKNVYTKMVLTISSKRAPANELVFGSWADVVSGIVDVALQDHLESLKLERFVRALTLQKPSLIRYNDLLEFRRKGNKVVAIQGANVNLDVLLPPVANSLDSVVSTVVVAPSCWTDAASLGHLVWSLVVCAECMVAVVEALALSRLGETTVPMMEQDSDLGIIKAIERFSLQSSSRVAEFNSCRDSLIEAARGIVSVLKSGLSGGTKLLEEHMARVMELVGMIHSADLGTPLDDPSSVLLHAVALKLRGACSAVMTSKGRSDQSSESKNKFRVLSLRVARLQSVIAMAVTIEAGTLLGKACASLSALASEFAAKTGGEQAVSTLSIAQLQVDAALASAQEGTSGRSAVLPLSRLAACSQRFGSSINEFWRSSSTVYQTERSLSRVIAHNVNMAPLFGPIHKAIEMKDDDTVYSRMLAIKRGAILCGESPATEILSAGGGVTTVVVDLTKLVTANLSVLSKLVTESSLLAADSTLLQMCSRVDISLLKVLKSLNAEVDDLRNLLFNERQVWNQFADACKLLSPSSAVVGSSVGRALESLGELWSELDEGSENSVREQYIQIEDRLKDTLLDLRIGVPNQTSYQCAEWANACKSLQAALDSRSSINRQQLLSSIKLVSQCAELIANKGGGAIATPLIESSLKLVAFVHRLDVALFDSVFDANSNTVSQLVDQALPCLSIMSRLVEGKTATMKLSSVAVSAVRAVSASEVGGVAASVGTVTAIISDLKCLYDAVQLVCISSGDVSRATVLASAERIAARLFENLNLVSIHSGLAQELYSSLLAFGSDTRNSLRSASGQNVLDILARVRDTLLNVGQLKAAVASLESGWGCGGKAKAAESGSDPMENLSEFSRLLEAASNDVAIAATRYPLELASKTNALVSLVSNAVLGLRMTSGSPIKRCFSTYAPIYAATSERGGNVCLLFGSDGERVVVLAEAVSLLCEGLESAGEEAMPGRKGMMGVRDALGLFAEASAQDAASFAAAAAAMHTALSCVVRDYSRVVLLVDVCHFLQKLISVVGSVLLDFNNLLLQSKLTKRRNRVVSVLQEFVADLKRQSDQSSGSTIATAVATPPPVEEISTSFQSSSPRETPSSSVVPPVRMMPPQKSPRKPTAEGNKSPRLEESSSLTSPPKSPRGGGAADLKPEAKSPRISFTKSQRAEEPQKSPREEPVSKNSGTRSPRPEQEPSRPAEPSFRPSEIATAPEAVSPPPSFRVSHAFVSSPNGPKCKGVFKYQAKNDGELSFQRGDEIELESGTDTQTPGIWKGRIAGSDGPFLAFPSKYTKFA